jgi:hypothetical protein
MLIHKTKALSGLPPACIVCGKATGGECCPARLEIGRWQAFGGSQTVTVPLDVPVCGRHKSRNAWMDGLRWPAIATSAVLFLGPPILAMALFPRPDPAGNWVRMAAFVGGVVAGAVVGFVFFALSVTWLGINSIWAQPEGDLVFLNPACPAFIDACVARFGPDLEAPAKAAP